MCVVGIVYTSIVALGAFVLMFQAVRDVVRHG